MTVELPEGWREVALNTVVKSKSGDSKIIKGKNASNPEVGLFQGYSATGPDVWVKQANHSGVGIVVSAVGARCGKTFLAKGEWTAIANTHVLLPLDGIDPKFLWYVSNREQWWIKSGTAQPFVKVKDTLERPFLLPPLAEQQRIVDILEEQFSRLDNALASIRTVREKAKAFRRSLLQAAFSGELTGGTEGWREVALGEVADTQLGKMLNSKKQTGTAKMPYLRNINLRWGAFDLSDVNEMDIFADEYEQFTLRNGDLLICEGGEPGRCAVWKGGEGMAFQNAMHRVRPNRYLDSGFLALQFEGRVKNGELDYLFSGVTIKHFSQQKLRSVKVNLPPLPEQQRIVDILEEQFSRLDNALLVADQLEARIASERRSLLHSAFTGELTAQWRRDVPEKVLAI